MPSFEPQIRSYPRGSTVPTPTTDLGVDEINLADPAAWGRADIDGQLALRRELRPIGRDEHRSSGRPFWSFLRWAHVATITADPITFSSSAGPAAPNDPGEYHVAENSLIAQDPPEHTATRKLVNRGFTPKQVRALAPAVDRRVQALIDELRTRPVGCGRAGRTSSSFPRSRPGCPPR